MPDKKTDKFEIVKRETLFQGYFRVDRHHIQNERFDGTWSRTYTREVFERARQVAGVLLFDPRQDKVILVEQFRAGVAASGDQPWLTEIVLGMVDVNETPEQTARREAKEEAGCDVIELHKIAGYYSSPGGTTEFINLFAGRTIAPANGSLAGLDEEDEDIRVHVLDAMKAIGMLYAGTIRDSQTLVAMQWFAMHHTELRSRWLMSDVGTPII